MAARFVTGNYIYETGSMTGILEQLKWESLKKGRRDSRIIMLYKGLKGSASIPTNDLVPQLGMSKIITLRHFNPPLLIVTFTRAVSFPRLLDTDSLLSAAECAEDSVAKFTSLVRARD